LFEDGVESRALFATQSLEQLQREVLAVAAGARRGRNAQGHHSGLRDCPGRVEGVEREIGTLQSLTFELQVKRKQTGKWRGNCVETTTRNAVNTEQKIIIVNLKMRFQTRRQSWQDIFEHVKFEMYPFLIQGDYGISH
jgi:hypothetical protein